MASAGAIRAGEAYVEITANTASLKSGLAKAQASLKHFGTELSAVGAGVFAAGAGGVAGFGASLKVFSDLEDVLANLRASINPTADEFSKITSAVNSISIGAGRGPSEVATAFTELGKAGLSTESILGGAAKSVVEFAKVGKLQVADAAITMADAMVVFKNDALSAAQAVDILSGAADASSVQIEQITQAFAQSSSVFASAGLSLRELAASISILGKAGIKGSDAGTSLKTFLQRLRAPSEEGAKALAEIGFSARDTAGNIIPVRDIIGQLNEKLAGLDKATRDDLLNKVFGLDAIRAVDSLLAVGVDGFDEFTDKIKNSLTVGEKFKILTGTLSGRLAALVASLQRVGVAVGESVTASFSAATDSGAAYLDTVTEIVRANKDIVFTAGKVALAVAGAGLAMLALGKAIIITEAALGILALAFKGVAFAIGLIGAPAVAAGILFGAFAVGMVHSTGGIGEAVAVLKNSFSTLADSASAAFKGITDALRTGDTKLAAEILFAELNVVFATGYDSLLKISAGFAIDFLYSLRKSFKVALGFYRDYVADRNKTIGGVTENLLTLGPAATALSLAFAPGGNTTGSRADITADDQDRRDLKRQFSGGNTEAVNAAVAALKKLTDKAGSAADAIAKTQAVQADEGLTIGRNPEYFTPIIGKSTDPDRMLEDWIRSFPDADSLLAGLPESAPHARKFSTAGFFNPAALFGQDFGGSSAAERTARATEKTAESTKKIAQNMPVFQEA